MVQIIIIIFQDGDQLEVYYKEELKPIMQIIYQNLLEIYQLLEK